MRDLVMLGMLLGVIPFIFKKPHIGALLWCWTAMLGPNYLVYGFAASIRYNFIFAVLTLVSWLISSEKFKFNWNSTMTLLVLFGCWGTFSALFSISDSDAVMNEWLKFIKIILFTFVVSGLLTTRFRIHSLLLILCLSLGFHGCAEGVKFILSGGSHHIYGPGTSIIGDNNHFALAMIMLLPVLFYLIRYSESVFTRTVLIASFFLISVSVIGTFSRGGFIGLVAIGFWGFLKTKKKFHITLLLIPLTIALLLLAPESWFSRMDTIQTVDQDRSFMGRIISWKLSTLLALDRPLLGGGFHSLQDLVIWLAYSQDFYRFDFIPTRLPDIHRAHAAHSIYFQVLGDMGFVGLGFFLFILFRTWRNATFVYQRAKEYADLRWAQDLAQMLQISLIAYMVSGAGLSMAYFELVFVFVALLVVLRKIVERRLRNRGADPRTPASNLIGG